MKKPSQTPLDPETPRSKKVTPIPMPKVYPESIGDDLYIASDNNKLDQINKILDETSNENIENSN